MWIQKEQQQKNAKLPLIKAVWKGIYHKTWKLQESVVLQKTPLNMNVNEDNYQSKVKKFNGKAVIVTPASKPVRTPAFTHMLKQATIANQIIKKIADQEVHSLTHQKLFIMIPDLKRIFT